VSLHQVLAWAAEHAPAVRVAGARVGLATAAEARATPLFRSNPFIHFGAGRRSEDGQSGSKVDAFLLQPMEVAGERRLRLDVAEQTKNRLEAEREATRWRVHRQVHQAFHEALLARERVQLARRVREFQERLLEYTQRRFEEGDVGQLPVRLTQGETAEARQNEIAMAQAYRSARLRLARVAGWPAGTPPVPAGALDEPRSAPPVEHLVELAQGQHPALRARDARVREARAQVELADREAWPEPMLGVAYGREAIGDQAEQSVLGLLRVRLPVWRRNQGDRAQARAALDIARSERNAVRFDLRARLARAAAEVDAAAERIRVYGEQVLPNFEENLAMLRRGLELGEFDILKVSLARERFLRIQRRALDAYGAYFDAVAELEAQVGSELWRDQGRP
jgi:cobalt-zinc-cadmium efflux system outer membrane protein